MFRLLQRSRPSRAACALAALALAGTALVGGLTTGAGAGVAGGPSPLGVYVGYQASNLVSSFGRAIGTQPTFAMDFLDGDSWSALVNTAPSYMAAWKNSGDTMIWGIPMLPNVSSGSGANAPSLGQGAAGAYNASFLKLAQDMVAGGQGDSIIRPGWEFNGGWFSWAANGQAAAFVGYWQQIVTTMRSVPGQDFTFEWNPTAGDEGVGNLANYYPGNAYVDSIGLDLYDQAWGKYTGIASQWNTYLTEPYGLNWLASFAASQGKPITLPEWGLGAGPGNDGAAVSASNSNVSGGDDPTFINDMAQWISTHNVSNATFWDYGTSRLSATSNPLSFAAFVLDFGVGSAVSLAGSSSSSSSSTTTTTVPPTTTPTTNSGGAGTTSSGNAWSPSEGSAFPGTAQTDSSVTIQSPMSPVVSSRSARFSAVVSAVPSGSLGRSGSVTWDIRSASGASVPCHSGNSVLPRTTGVTRCNVAPGALSAGDGPYAVSVRYPGSSGVAPSSATLTQSVSKGASRVRLRVTPAAAPAGGEAVTATVVGLPAAAGTPTGTVTFAVAGPSGQSLQCAGGSTVALASGTATCDIPASATPHSASVLTAAYSGDDIFSGSTSRSRTFRLR
jgi:hypothetical protein